MEMCPVTCHTLEEFYHIDSHTFKSNIRKFSVDTASMTSRIIPMNGCYFWAIQAWQLTKPPFPMVNLYTFVTHRDASTRECSLVAVVFGTKSEDVISVLQRIDEEHRYAIEEVTLNFSDSMRKIVGQYFPKPVE